MGRIKPFENSECRRLFAAFAALAVLFFIFIVIVGVFGICQIQTHLLQREQAVAGLLINNQPSKTEEISKAFVTRDASQQSLGKTAFEHSGYSGYTVDIVIPSLHSDIKMFTFIYLFSAGIAFSIMIILFYFFLSKIYRRIDDAGHQALRVSQGHYDIKLPDNIDGTIGRMNHSFNEMSAGVNAGFDKLSRERVFLKNLISDISHQLKTPLAALKMYNEIIIQETLSDAARDFVKKSGEQLDRMEWLILGLLKMARVEAGYLEMNIQQNDIYSVVLQAVSDFSTAAQEKDIQIVMPVDDHPLVACDPGWLKEAFGNVIKNCIEYTPSGGKIGIHIEQTPVMVSVQIRDTGQGIHPDDLPFIFRRFYRGRGRNSAGVGIGLNLAKSIIEQMGGALSAGGEYGKGAVFTFSFFKDVI